MEGTARTAVPDQNLINPSKLPEMGKPAGFWKAVILDLFGVLSALFFGYSYFRYLTTGLSPWYAVAFFLAFASLSVLQVFFVQNPLRRTFVILCETVALIVCFFFYDDVRTVLIAGGIAFVALLWGYFSSHGDVRNDLEVQFFHSTRNVLGKIVTAVLLIMIIVYIPQAQGDNIFMSRDNFRTLFDWAAGFVANFYPGLPIAGSYGDLSHSIAHSELASSSVFKGLTEPQQNVAIDQAIAELSDAVTKTTGVAPTQSEPVSDVAYDYIISALMGMKDKFQGQFVVIWIIILFLVLRTVGIVAVWIAQFAALILYELLLAVGFMHIEEVTQTKELIGF